MFVCFEPSSDRGITTNMSLHAPAAKKIQTAASRRQLVEPDEGASLDAGGFPHLAS